MAATAKVLDQRKGTGKPSAVVRLASRYRRKWWHGPSLRAPNPGCITPGRWLAWRGERFLLAYRDSQRQQWAGAIGEEGAWHGELPRQVVTQYLDERTCFGD